MSAPEILHRMVPLNGIEMHIAQAGSDEGLGLPAMRGAGSLTQGHSVSSITSSARCERVRRPGAPSIVL